MLAVRAFAFVFGCSAAADDAPSAIADIGEVLGQHVVNDLPVSQSMVTASNIMKAMSRLPAPASRLLIQSWIQATTLLLALVIPITL